MQSGNSDVYVAVWMVTYNHEKYISRCIESVINQKTDFNFRLFIGEDCSSDNTLEICASFFKKFPDKITLLESRQNLGASANAKRVYKECIDSSAKYITMIEGDDFWTDMERLQKLVGLMDQSDQFVACFHNAHRINDSDSVIGQVYNPRRNRFVKMDDLLQGDYMKTCCLLFRNSNDMLKPMMNGMMPIEDTSVGYCLLSNGRMAVFISEIMAAYTVHSGGVWSMISTEKRLEKIMENLLVYRLFFKNDRVIYPKFLKMMRQHLKLMLVFYLRSFKALKAVRAFGFLIRYFFI